MKKRMLPRLAPALLLLLAAVLAGCNKNETDDNQLPDGKQPLEFTSQMYGMEVTRSTSDNNWEGGEFVAVQIGNEVKKYIADTNGKLTAASGETPFYWKTSTSDTKIVSAWFPYTNTPPSSFYVQEDQTLTNYQESDMIYAAATTFTYSSSPLPQLIFKHLPAKVVMNLKAGSGVNESEVQNATVILVNQNCVSGTISTDGSVAQQTVMEKSSIVPNEATSSSDFQKSVQALVVPQRTALKRLISIKIGKQEFFYSTAPNFEAGKQYTYNITVAKPVASNANPKTYPIIPNNITVAKTDITVTASEAELWTEATTKVPSNRLVAGYAANDLKIGDYYYSDGTWSDGGYRKYNDNTTAIRTIMPVLKDANGKTRTVVGIVYWVGSITGDDALLVKEHSTCTHGLVVALQDVSASSTKWCTSDASVNAWTNATDRSENKLDITVADKMQGYSNTKALTAYNKQHSTDGYDVLPIADIAKYVTEHPAPAGSSGWYFPSIMELKYMCWGQGNADGTKGYELLNTQFAKVSGARSFQPYYWSSSEHPQYNSMNVQHVNFNYGYVRNEKKSNITRGGNKVRSILAF